MKKTIIAAAVAAAVAAPAAFADVSISGMVNYEYADEAQAAEAAGADTGALGNVNTDLVFSGSEDLGNGMKASWKYHTMADDGALTVADTSVSLSGDFGTIVAGRMEPFVESKADSYLDIDASHDLKVEDDRGQISRANQAIAYVSPNFNGLSIGVAGVSSASSGANSDDFDVVDIYASYSNAGLTVWANQATQAVSTGNKEKTITSYGAGYKMGDLEVRVAKREVENINMNATNDDDRTATGIAVKYTMGANTLAVTHNKFEVDGANTGPQNDNKATVMSVSHALSKRTSVYLARRSTDAQASTGRNDEDQTMIGLKHTF